MDVKEVKASKPVEIDDEFAKGLGIESLDKLKEMIRERIGQDYAQVSRARVKRVLLDKLAESHDFAVPQGMVTLEHRQVRVTETAVGDPDEDPIVRQRSQL